jgi:hypothetical protein
MTFLIRSEDGQTYCVTAEVSALSGELTITRTELVELDDGADSDDGNVEP